MDSTPVHRSDCPNGKKEVENTSQHASLPSFLQHEAVSTISDWRNICSVTDTVVNVEHCKTTWQMVKTIRGSGTETTLYDERIGYNSVILFTARGTNEFNLPFVKSKGKQEAVLGHSSGAEGVEFDYVIFG